MSQKFTVRNPDGSTEEMNLTLEFKCPFCGLFAGACLNPHAVVHGVPHCEKFAKLDAADYMTAVRVATQGDA